MMHAVLTTCITCHISKIMSDENKFDFPGNVASHSLKKIIFSFRFGHPKIFEKHFML